MLTSMMSLYLLRGSRESDLKGDFVEHRTWPWTWTWTKMGEDEKVCVRLAKDDPKKDIGRLGTVCRCV